MAPLSSSYGLAADNVLEYELVSTEGKSLVASPQENKDLYWALSGGGGTFGVVLSMTTKAHPDGIVAGASLTLNSTALGSQTFWSIVTAWHHHSLTMNQIPGFSANWGITAD